MEKKNDKTKEIKKYIDQLDDIIPSSLEEYESDLEKKAACERYLEKIVEAVIDLAFIVVKQKKLDLPSDDFNAFDILEKAKIIDGDLSKRLKQAKGMRNFISHQYDKINDKLVFQAVSEKLEKDVKEFLKKI